MVPSSYPIEGRNYFYSQIGDGGLSETHIYGYAAHRDPLRICNLLCLECMMIEIQTKEGG